MWKLKDFWSRHPVDRHASNPRQLPLPDLPPLPQRDALPSPRAALDENENVLTADAKEVGVKNAAEETFRPQQKRCVLTYSRRSCNPENMQTNRPCMPDEIKLAARLMEKSEATTDLKLRLQLFKNGARTLDDYAKSNELLAPDVASYLANLRMAHTRVLLQYLPTVPWDDFDLWLLALACMIKVNPERERLTSQTRELNSAWDTFLAAWKKELQAAFNSNDRSANV